MGLGEVQEGDEGPELRKTGETVGGGRGWAELGSDVPQLGKGEGGNWNGGTT